MPRLQQVATNFSGGEFSPLLAGRVDLEKWNSSARTLSNVVALKQGGVTIRPPLTFQVATKDSSKLSRLIGFVYSRTDAYQLEFGDFYIRVRRANGTVVESSPGVPYEIATSYANTQLADLDFSQGDDTMIITHPSIFPKRLRRFSETNWVYDDAPLVPQPVSELGYQLITVNMTLSLGTIGAGRTLTATSAVFLASDVGREVIWGGGRALITGFTSALIVTVTVTAVFLILTGYGDKANGPLWTLVGSPQTTLTPGTASPEGATTTLVLTANGWRTSDVGSLVEVNGGLVRITAVTDALNASGIILRELTSTTGAVAGSWAILSPIWNSQRGYPKTCCFYQQRLWFGNTEAFPQSVWGSRTGLYFDFTPGVDDDSAVYKTTAVTDEVNPLQFLCGAGSLVMLGYSAEVEGKGGIEKPITQTNMQINSQSEWGADNIRPVSVGKEILFAERGAKSLRALFPQQVEGYDSTDVSVFSEHLLASGITAIAYERKPNSVLWVATADGGLNAFTYNREQNTLAWCGGGTSNEGAAGVVESLSTVPSSSSDVTDAVVRRVINGVTVRNIERLDWTVNAGVTTGFSDSRVVQTYGAPTATWTGFTQHANREVVVHADGIYMGLYTVSGAGVITGERAATTVTAGYPYTSTIVLPKPEVGTGTGTSSGQATSINKIQVRVHNTVGLKVNGEEVAFRYFDAPATLDNPPTPFTGLKEVTSAGWDNDEGADLTLTQDQGLPWTILAVIRTLTVNAG